MRQFLVCVCVVFAAAQSFGDTVDLTGVGSNDPVVLIDAEINGVCENDMWFRGPSPIDVGNVTISATCSPELIAFSKSNAVAVQLAPAFTATVDNLTVNMSSRVSVPVQFWIITSPQLAGTEAAAEAARDHMRDLVDGYLEDADRAYDESRAGITFENLGHIFIDDDAAWSQDMGARADGVFQGTTPVEEYVKALKAKINAPTSLSTLGTNSIDPDVLNVFVLEAASPQTRGFHISRSDGSPTGYISLRLRTDVATLAHEIGHALSLAHINFIGADAITRVAGEYCVAYGEYSYLDGVCDYLEKNLMWAGQDIARETLTEGQGMRASLNSQSFVSRPSIPSGPPRDCPDRNFHRTCPYVAIDED